MWWELLQNSLFVLRRLYHCKVLLLAKLCCWAVAIPSHLGLLNGLQTKGEPCWWLAGCVCCFCMVLHRKRHFMVLEMKFFYVKGRWWWRWLHILQWNLLCEGMSVPQHQRQFVQQAVSEALSLSTQKRHRNMADLIHLLVQQDNPWVCWRYTGEMALSEIMLN